MDGSLNKPFNKPQKCTGIRMNAVNSKNINHYFDFLEEEYGFNEHSEAIYTTWMKLKTGMSLIGTLSS